MGTKGEYQLAGDTDSLVRKRISAGLTFPGKRVTSGQEAALKGGLQAEACSTFSFHVLEGLLIFQADLVDQFRIDHDAFF